MIESSIERLTVSIVVVVPFTSKFPATVKFLPTETSKRPSTVNASSPLSFCIINLASALSPPRVISTPSAASVP